MTDQPLEPLYEERSALTEDMVSTEREKEGTFLSGGADLILNELEEEKPLDPELILNPKPVRDGPVLLDFLRKNLHRFDSPYSYIGGEANSPDRERFHAAEVRVLITRLSTYEATSLSLAHSLLAQIALELPNAFVDLAFHPKPTDYRLLKENGFPVWFGANTKLAPDKFDLIAISHPLSMEQMNFIPLLHDSGIPIFKDQRMERPDLPLVFMGGMNSRTCAPLSGSWTDPEGKEHSHLLDGVVVGDGEITLKQLISTIAMGKKLRWSKRETLRYMHGKIHGFYEPDCYVHEYDGRGTITKIRHAEGREYAALPVRGAVVPRLDAVRGLESKILPFSGTGCSVDYGIAGSRGCIGGPGGNCSFSFVGDQLLTTKKGMRTFEEIATEEALQETYQDWDEKVGSEEGVLPATRFFLLKGEKETVSVRSSIGTELKVTPEHKVRTYVPFKGLEYKQAANLTTEDLLVFKPGTELWPEKELDTRELAERASTETKSWQGQRPLPQTLTEDWALWMGLLAGDGCTTRRKYGSSEDMLSSHMDLFVGRDERYLDTKLQKFYGEMFGKTRYGIDFKFEDRARGVGKLSFSDRRTRNFLELLGVARVPGPEKEVPWSIRRSPRHVVLAYLAGYFSTDGCIHGQTPYFGSTSEKLIRQVQALLFNLGIQSRLYSYKNTAEDPALSFRNKGTTTYKIFMSGVFAQRFATLIKPFYDHKATALEQLRTRERGRGFTNPPYYTPQFKGQSRAEKKSLREDLEKLWTEKGLTVAAVTSVEKGPNTNRVYDCTVPGPNNVIVNGGQVAAQCREGNEAPYRERSLKVILDGLARATKNQGTKEVTYFSLNFNQHTDFFPLVHESVKRGYQVGLISQRIDMLAESPEQVRVQRWLAKSNFSLGVEGISERLRSFLTKNTTEEQILTTIKLMMEENAGEIKLYYIICGNEDEGDVQEYLEFMDKVEAIKKAGHHTSSMRISFTPLFPSAGTPLQFYPVFAALNKGSRSLDAVFAKARDLRWKRRLSISGEEPIISNLIALGGRNVFPILLASHFQDGFRFYGHIPKGTWARWKRRIDQEPNLDTDITFGEKKADFIFPWDDILMGMPKETLHEEYLRCTAFKGSSGYCLTTRLKKGKCDWKRCGLCSLGTDDRKPNFEVVQAIINRKVAPVIPLRTIEEAAKTRDKTCHLRVRFRTTDPVYRFIEKSYFLNAIPRALMLTSPRFDDAFIKALGHARAGAGANDTRDWTFGENIYDFALSEHLPESELKALIPEANRNLRQGEILDLRTDPHLTVLRNDVDFAVYTCFIPSSGLSFGQIRSDFERHFERRGLGRETKIKVRKAKAKGVYTTVEQSLHGDDVRLASYQWLPEHRGTLLRLVTGGRHNPFAVLEALTKRKAHLFKPYPIYCHGYVQLPQDGGETDIFAALMGQGQRCRATGLPLERDLFTGEPMKSGLGLAAEEGMDANFPVDMNWFYTKELQAVEVLQAAE